MDPDNIFQLLVGNQPLDTPTNIMQTAAPADSAPTPAPSSPPVSPQTIATVQAATDASPPAPKPRRSLLDTIGRISDVFAKVGGAEALYQPTLDARVDRARQIDMDALKNNLTKTQITAAQDTHDDSSRTRWANALGAVNDSEDAALWPQIAQAAGLDPARSEAIGKIIQANPESAKVFASALGGGGNDDESKLGKNLYFGTDTKGATVAYQIGPDGKPHILDFGGNVTPSEPTKIVNTGPTSVVVGQSGNVKKILPNGTSPNTILTTTTSRENNQNTNKTALTIAGMPARAKDGAAGGKNASDPQAGLKIISDIQKSFDNLHNLNALPGEGGVVENLIGTLGRTHLGQKIGATTGLSHAAQEREILGKNLANLQSDLVKSLPGNATRTRFEQEIQKKRLPDPTTMNYVTANRAIAEIRDAYTTALNASRTPVKAAPKNSGWTVVGVK